MLATLYLKKKQNMKNLLYLLCLVTLCFSCGDDDSCSHDSGVLSGTILGNDFELKQGTATYDNSEEEYQVFLFGQDEIDFGSNPCTASALDFIGTQLTFFVANSPQTQNLTGTSIVSIYNATTLEFEAASSDGCITVNEINATTVSGSITFNSGGNSVSGKWDALICN